MCDKTDICVMLAEVNQALTLVNSSSKSPTMATGVGGVTHVSGGLTSDLCDWEDNPLVSRSGGGGGPLSLDDWGTGGGGMRDPAVKRGEGIPLLR